MLFYLRRGAFQVLLFRPFLLCYAYSNSSSGGFLILFLSCLRHLVTCGCGVVVVVPWVLFSFPPKSGISFWVLKW